MAADGERAYIGLGSNLADPVYQVRSALDRLDALPETRLAKASGLYRTAPWGVTDQPEFVNAVAAVDTRLRPLALLEALQSEEGRAGRARGGRRWGPRVLDLDLLLFGNDRHADERLTLPHPRMHERAFVLVPLLEIAPGIGIPGVGKAAAALEKLNVSDVQPLEGCP